MDNIIHTLWVCSNLWIMISTICGQYYSYFGSIRYKWCKKIYTLKTRPIQHPYLFCYFCYLEEKAILQYFLFISLDKYMYFSAQWYKGTKYICVWSVYMPISLFFSLYISIYTIPMIRLGQGISGSKAKTLSECYFYI